MASIALIVALVVILTTVAPVVALEETVEVAVTVNTMLSFNIEDAGNAGLQFGSLVPGGTANPDLAQGSSGAVRLWLGIETNVDCQVVAKADDFASGSEILAIGNVRWGVSNDFGAADAMTKSYTVMTALSPGMWRDVWYWLSVPADQPAGDYTAAFYYQVQEVTSEV